ncbi:MAG: D-aminoacyl-tRNA deacylase [Erysipelotrichales bacterium]|nr:D-aminoacyl-tRNA deacylase [Erysipelotrichales bacterium]
MKVIIQRVKEASVSVETKIIGKIKQGMLILVGFKENDDLENVKKMALKISLLRIFADANNKMNLNIKEFKGQLLSVSQFTLYADTEKGNRPSFVNSLEKEQANILFLAFNQELENILRLKIETGSFGANMEVSLINDGPVTIILEN